MWAGGGGTDWLPCEWQSHLLGNGEFRKQFRLRLSNLPPDQSALSGGPGYKPWGFLTPRCRRFAIQHQNRDSSSLERGIQSGSWGRVPDSGTSKPLEAPSCPRSRLKSKFKALNHVANLFTSHYFPIFSCYFLHECFLVLISPTKKCCTSSSPTFIIAYTTLPPKNILFYVSSQMLFSS